MSDGVTVDGSLFEALARVLQPQGAYAEELRAAGFDVRAPKMRYPNEVLVATLDITHKHLYPDLTREQAHRRVGQRMVGSFFDTIFGKVVRTLLQVLGPERFLVRLPKIAPMGTTGLHVRVERPAPGEVRLFFSGQLLSPSFIAGAMEATSTGISVELVLPANPTAFELRVTGLR
ncbi:MAG TPA: DUF2378 family protein [Myxococcaceae bacterium]|nr:DUF2378 family protein [Myxococcaceae bacterium]